MGGPTPWHGRTRALPATWPSQDTTQRSTGSKWAACWHRGNHFWPLNFFFSSRYQLWVRFNLCSVNDGILRNFGLSSHVKTCWVSWALGYAKRTMLCSILFLFMLSTLHVWLLSDCNSFCLLFYICYKWLLAASWCHCNTWCGDLHNRLWLSF